ncbi:hypothetical protein [Elizabethkingia anophelis]|uniref:hypothetical protein n=1 Tax=Elizabethkingia anophelis TaxID=1117645 RepID=UPI000999D31C|nr:hypothetical protein [Elizabethkingia anophelis]MDV4129854.1 hypothetical protein [Elizabethkingia anophelis]MDV4135711.1 hypothetical protein [Elizabethkingia anophelis]OPC60823.1 hypothetical protein BAY08_12425 [Elizabethkingia anophelis]GJN63131.1 hypothetical protein ELAK_32810 [Elizabethkingia anophelis]HDP3254652.1 hypothetical protein [Elizabethkingia anophelis]
MAHEPKLSAYIIKLNPKGDDIENSNRNLVKNLTGNTSEEEEYEDSFLFMELFKTFIKRLDTQEMYSDSVSKKCFTAYQSDIESPDVDQNITPHSTQFIIEGIVEGGNYGRKRNKTSTTNKNIKSNVDEKDAITDSFYFLLYTPLYSNKSILLIQSYSDDTIDYIVKKFFQDLFRIPNLFKKPSVEKYVPQSIIDKFKAGATVSELRYSTEVPSQTLLYSPISTDQQYYRVTIKFEPVDTELTYEECEKSVKGLGGKSIFEYLPLRLFKKKKGVLKATNGKTTPFELNEKYDIKPTILLSDFIMINNDESDFERIKEYCFTLLKELKGVIYTNNAVQER